MELKKRKEHSSGNGADVLPKKAKLESIQMNMNARYISEDFCSRFKSSWRYEAPPTLIIGAWFMLCFFISATNRASKMVRPLLSIVVRYFPELYVAPNWKVLRR